MSDLVKQFNFENQNLTVINIDGESWFIAKEIGGVLGYKDKGFTTLIGRDWKNEFDEDMLYKLEGEKLKWFKEVRRVEDSSTRQIVDYTRLNSLLLLSEQGVYLAVMLSKKPIGKKVRKWLSKDVLPSIKKTGAYVEKTGDDPIIMIAQQIIGIRELQIEQAKKVEALESDVNKIKEVHRCAEDNLEKMPEPSVNVKEKSVRASLNEFVNNYSRASGIDRVVIWTKLYNELYYRCSFNVSSRYKNNQKKGVNKNLSKIDIVDNNGMLPQLYAIAKEVLIIENEDK